MLIAAVGLLALQARAVEEDGVVVKGPNVRVIKHADGSESMLTRSPDQKVITKRTSKGGRVVLVTVYRLHDNGNLLSCDIYDGQKTRLYRVDYGYRKDDGQLVMERMFDCRVRNVWKNRPDVEKPVRIVEYLIDAQGKASKPVVRTYLEGETFERDYGAPTSAINPKIFDESKPAGQGGPATGTPTAPAGR
jgi:hypothetical protein